MAKPTMDDVARRAGVSRAWSSLALRDSGKVSASSRAVMAAADELGYRPNLIARHLASKQTRTLGLLINDLHNPYFPGCRRRRQARCRSRGYRLLLNSAWTTTTSCRARDVHRLPPDGIILTGARCLRRDRGAGRDADRRREQADAIRRDRHDQQRRPAGATLAVEHLVEPGAPRIGHIDGGHGAGAAQRRSGYEAMRKHGLERRCCPGPSPRRPVRGRARALKPAARSPRSSPATTSARWALDAIDEVGLEVPEDISLVVLLRQHVRRHLRHYAHVPRRRRWTRQAAALLAPGAVATTAHRRCRRRRGGQGGGLLAADRRGVEGVVVADGRADGRPRTARGDCGHPRRRAGDSGRPRPAHRRGAPRHPDDRPARGHCHRGRARTGPDRRPTGGGRAARRRLRRGAADDAHVLAAGARHRRRRPSPATAGPVSGSRTDS